MIKDWNIIMNEVSKIKTDIDQTKDLKSWIEKMRRFYDIHVGLLNANYEKASEGIKEYNQWINER